MEALRRAYGAKRNAEHAHEQIVAAVVRLRGNLAAAETKERTAARALAETEEARRFAAQALVRAEGAGPSAPTAPDDGADKKMINVQ